MDDFGRLLNRLHCARLVVGGHDRNQRRRPGAEQALQMIEVDQAGPVAGSSVGSASSGPKTFYVQAKITSIGQLLPAAAFGSGACVQDMMQVTGQHITRAHVIVGPISQ